jgi:hypothetical protein
MAKVISRRVVEMGRSFGPGNEASHELRCHGSAQGQVLQVVSATVGSPGLRRANHLLAAASGNVRDYSRT